jgi:hypothetical protein
MMQNITQSHLTGKTFLPGGKGLAQIQGLIGVHDFGFHPETPKDSGH